jgi:hypothetical protein
MEVVRSFIGRLRVKYYFHEDQGFRLAAVRNAAARLAASPILIFLDSGTLAGPRLVSGHLAAHAEGGERRAVMGYCYGYNGFGEQQWAPDSFYTLKPTEIVQRYHGNELFADVRERDFARSGSDPMAWTLPWMYFFTMNCSVSTEDFWAVGGFDEMFRSWGVEDIEFGYRVYHNGCAIMLSRDAWAIEIPAVRPLKRQLYSLIRNGRLFLEKFREPYIEMLLDAYLGIRLTTIMDESTALERWICAARDLDVHAEIEAAAAGLAADARLAIIGCGPSVPARLPGAVLADFDAGSLARATAGGRHTGYHAIGLHTPLPSRSADVVIITSRLSGLWDRYGDQIAREASRIGRRVVLTADLDQVRHGCSAGTVRAAGGGGDGRN